MALKAGAKSRTTRPLPPADLGVDTWVDLVAGGRLYPWQRAELVKLFDPGRPRAAYIQVPRKNGKTRLAALLALAEACLKERRHVYAVSDSERNLNTTFTRELRDLIGGSEYLRDSIHVFKSHFEVPSTGSFIEMRPNKFSATQGINPHVVIFDEVHLQRSPDLWSGMQMAGAARPDALLLGITTPGYDLTSHAHSLYEQVRSGSDALYGRIFEAPAGVALDDRDAWRVANPASGYMAGFDEAMSFDRETLPEHEFRRFRLGQWTATESAWLPYGAWAACAAPDRPVPPSGSRVWLGFDGSTSEDSTALVGVTPDLHVFVVGCWENPGRAGWRVPRDEVKAAVEDAFLKWDVVGLDADPPYWGAEIAEWTARWPGRVAEFPTWSRARSAPACTTFYAGVMERALTHDGDPRLARHISNAVVRPSPLGDWISKPTKDSPAKVDLAVAAVIAYAAAAGDRKPARKPVFVL